MNIISEGFPNCFQIDIFAYAYIMISCSLIIETYDNTEGKHDIYQLQISI